MYAKVTLLVTRDQVVLAEGPGNIPSHTDGHLFALSAYEDILIETVTEVKPYLTSLIYVKEGNSWRKANHVSLMH